MSDIVLGGLLTTNLGIYELPFVCRRIGVPRGFLSVGVTLLGISFLIPTLS